MLKYIRTIFCEDNGASFSRYATAFATVISCGCVLYLTLRNHALPDGGQLLGLGGFMTAPYAVNKGTAIFTRHGDDSGILPSVSAAGHRPESVANTFWAVLIPYLIVGLLAAFLLLAILCGVLALCAFADTHPQYL